MLNVGPIRIVALLAWLALPLSCRKAGAPAPPVIEIRAGIFFGGQLQQRATWPLVLDPTRQTQGFRVHFREPLAQPVHLTWELTRPRLDHKRRAAIISSPGEATVPVGAQQHDQLITLDERDRTGKYRLHVSIDNVSRFDQTIEVVPNSPSPSDD